ncbi:hypothetical protein [Planococcus beigongshangi]|uniref:hypothetical protein n=1 Tax=Planococcus beigongshangi TaxID=2782536 RepID=UPI00193B0E36|nr:hypothetical protein [Planococcus beigongshangi]
MKYFVDHLRKSIHSQQFAGDSCGFIDTPVTYREFTNCPAYIKGLIEEKAYSRCTECVSAPTKLQQKVIS